MDIDTSSDPLLHMVYVLDSLAVGLSIINICLNCLGECKTQISGSLPWDFRFSRSGVWPRFFISCKFPGDAFGPVNTLCPPLPVTLSLSGPCLSLEPHQSSPSISSKVRQNSSWVPAYLFRLLIYLLAYFYIGALFLFLLLRMAFIAMVHSISFEENRVREKQNTSQ